jgi:hypothetical protein
MESVWSAICCKGRKRPEYILPVLGEAKQISWITKWRSRKPLLLDGSFTQWIRMTLNREQFIEKYSAKWELFVILGANQESRCRQSRSMVVKDINRRVRVGKIDMGDRNGAKTISAFDVPISEVRLICNNVNVIFRSHTTLSLRRNARNISQQSKAKEIQILRK